MPSTMKLRLQGLICIISLLSLAACGASSPAANSGKAGSGAGAAGTGGKSAGLPCGSARCTAPQGFTGELCCHDAFSSACGEKTMADQCAEFPAQQDAMCPDGTVVQSVGAMLVRGCCLTDTNQCGLDLTGGGIIAGLAGTDCVTYDNANTFSSFSTGPDGGTATTSIPSPTNCDGTPGM